MPLRRWTILTLLAWIAAGVPFAGARSAQSFAREGNEHFNAGRLDQAVEAYRRALQQDPASPLIKYNLGTALAHTGHHEEARQVLSEAARAESTLNRRDAFFNLGVSLAEPVINAMREKQDPARPQAPIPPLCTRRPTGVLPANSQPEDLRANLEEALNAFRQAILTDSEDEYAVYNYEVVQQVLERLRKQQEQQQQQQGDQQQNGDQQQQDGQSDESRQNGQQQQGDQSSSGNGQQSSETQSQDSSRQQEGLDRPQEQEAPPQEQARQDQGLEREEGEQQVPQPGEGGKRSEPMTPEQMNAQSLLNLLEEENPEQFKRLFQFRGRAERAPAGKDW